MVISVSKKEIFLEVEKRSSLEGAMIPEQFEGVWASTEEGQFLDSFWIEGCTAVIQMMKRYLTNTTLNHSLDFYDPNKDFIINADMPERYNTLLDGSVATDIKMLIACNILNGWLKIKKPDSAEKYEVQATEYSEDLRAKLLFRTDPKQNVVTPVNDGSKFEAEAYLNKADADTSTFDKEAYLNKADADAAKFDKEGFLNKAEDDGVAIEAESYLNGADADTEKIEAESYLNGADADTEAIGAKDFIKEADKDTENFEDEKYLNEADDDSVTLKDADAGIYAADRKCCDKNIYPEYEFIGKKKDDGVELKQGWNRKFDCRCSRFS